jgi:hypothetical protein
MCARQQVLSFWSMTLNLSLVDVAAQPHVAMQTFGSNGASRLDDRCNKSVEVLTGQVRDTVRSDAPNTRPVFLCSDDNQSRFFRCPPDDSWFLATLVGFVSLNHAGQSISVRRNYSPAQFGQDRPGGFIVAQTEGPLQSQRADAVLWAVTSHIVRNQIVNGRWLSWKTVPAVTDTSYWIRRSADDFGE